VDPEVEHATGRGDAALIAALVLALRARNPSAVGKLLAWSTWLSRAVLLMLAVTAIKNVVLVVEGR